MAQNPDTQRRQPRVNPTIGSEHKLEGLDTLEIRFVEGGRWGRLTNGPEFWVNLFGFVILEVAIVIGWIAATGGRLNGSWKTVLIVLAAAALGFGAAHLLARRSADSQRRELVRDYEELRERSRRLLGAVGKVERPSRPSESSTSLDTAP